MLEFEKASSERRSSLSGLSGGQSDLLLHHYVEKGGRYIGLVLESPQDACLSAMGHQASRALCIRSGARIDAVVPPGRTKMLGYFFSRGAFEADWFSGALCGPRFVSGAGHSGCVRSKKPDFSPSSKVFQPTTRSAASAQQAASRKEEEDRATIIRGEEIVR